MLDHFMYYIIYIVFMCMHNIIFIWRGGSEINTVIIQNNYNFIKINISINV